MPDEVPMTTQERAYAATIRNKNTRLAYARAVAGFLLYCEDRGFTLQSISPFAVAGYIEKHSGSPPTANGLNRLDRPDERDTDPCCERQRSEA